jgi:alpha-glucosidase (family GH31 glycosyl hydrolase)
MKHSIRQGWNLPMMRTLALLFLLGLTACQGTQAAILSSTRQPGRPVRISYSSGKASLVVEFLDDDLVHFQYSPSAVASDVQQPIAVTPMVQKTDYTGPKSFSNDGKGALETADLTVEVNPNTLCVTATDKTQSPPLKLTTTCPADSGPGSTALKMTAESMRYVYGLGEYFIQPGANKFNWKGQVRIPGDSNGNAMTSFFGGATGNAQFPVLYAMNEKGQNYALFVDTTFPVRWEFLGDPAKTPWSVQITGQPARWYLMSGPDLPDLRHDYMELTGNPPVPPKKMFGLWISEYGFDNWDELDDKLKTLRAHNFPVDGFVMDLQWYGGITQGFNSQMGALEWNQTAFPDPKNKIRILKDQDGIGLMVIEESYVSQGVPLYKDLLNRGYLVKKVTNPADTPVLTKWWGIGSMIDWTNLAGADYVFNQKIQPLVQMGVLGHWIDLGEPEMYDPDTLYAGLPEQGLTRPAGVNNLFSFRWAESLARGYNRSQDLDRPFMLSRSGTSGIQRFGTSMWSGDIGSNLISLGAHNIVQGQMSLSGLDYFGSDIGGFHRESANNDIDEIYTKWFAQGSLLDVPVRVHTENLCNCKETAPDRIGDVQSNLANIRLRYTLSPYLYSLAYRAYLFGDPYAPPLVYAYQSDPAARTISDEKLLGKDLLVATITALGQEQRDVYLPAGKWANFYTNEWVDGGQTLHAISARVDGHFQLPIFVRSGAILPLLKVDAQTMNILGKTHLESSRSDLIVRVYASDKASAFTLYEDDGQTVAYQKGQYRKTELSQQMNSSQVTVTIGSAEGSFASAPNQRTVQVELVLPSGSAAAVELNGAVLPEQKSRSDFDASASGWMNVGNNLVLVKASPQDVSLLKKFIVRLKP